MSHGPQHWKNNCKERTVSPYKESLSTSCGPHKKRFLEVQTEIRACMTSDKKCSDPVVSIPLISHLYHDCIRLIFLHTLNRGIWSVQFSSWIIVWSSIYKEERKHGRPSGRKSVWSSHSSSLYLSTTPPESEPTSPPSDPANPALNPHSDVYHSGDDNLSSGRPQFDIDTEVSTFFPLTILLFI
jgi:hypothetical protein